MDNLNEAKRSIKLIEYIQGDKVQKGKYTFVNPCPICGHNNHFAIIQSTNSWITYSKCGNSYTGGEIIEFMCAAEGYSVKDAIKEIRRLTGIERENISARKINKIKQEQDNKRLKLEREKIVINKCYSKLCNLFLALKNIKHLSLFYNWLYHFLDSYTDKFINSDSHEEQYNLCLNFKSEFDICYKEFLRFEEVHNEVNRSN